MTIYSATTFSLTRTFSKCQKWERRRQVNIPAMRSSTWKEVKVRFNMKHVHVRKNWPNSYILHAIDSPARQLLLRAIVVKHAVLTRLFIYLHDYTSELFCFPDFRWVQCCDFALRLRCWFLESESTEGITSCCIVYNLNLAAVLLRTAESLLAPAQLSDM